MLFKKREKIIDYGPEHFGIKEDRLDFQKEEVDAKEDQLESQEKEKTSRFHIITNYILDKYTSHPEYDKNIYLGLISEILDDYSSDSGIILDERYIHYKRMYIDLTIKKNLLLDYDKKQEASFNTIILPTSENLEKISEIRAKAEERKLYNKNDNELSIVMNRITCIIEYFEEKYGPLSYNQKIE